MIFKKEIEIYSALQKEELIKNLLEITEKFHSDSSDKYKFEGKVNENDFILYPTFDFGPHEQLRPEIVGEISTQNTKRKILLKFRLSKGMRILFIAGFILNVVVMITMLSIVLISPKLFDFPHWNKWWVIPIFMILTLIIHIQYFNAKVYKSIDVLERVFNDVNHQKIMHKH